MVNTDIEAHAQRDGGQVALRTATGALSYADLVHEIDRTVARLKMLGFDGRRPVAVLCENRAEIMLFYYAIARLGGTFVPVNASLSAAEVAYLLEHAEAVVLVYDERMQDIAAAALAAGGTTPGMTLDAFMGTDAPACEVTPVNGPLDPFLMVYTSGSTGKPKGVAMSQVHEVAGNASLIEMWGMGPQDVNVVALPMGYHYGLTTATGATLQSGGQAVLLRRFHPREVLEALVQHRATVFQGVPTMFAMMLEYAEQNSLEIDLSFMRLLISAGAPLSTELHERFEKRFARRIDDYYALTETRPIFGRYWNDPAPVPARAIGKVAPGAVVKIVDPEGRDVPDGVEGEYYVRGPSATLGYLKNEAQTRELFHDGLIRTGDLGHRDSEGFYYITGRSKDLIIRGGANIAPAEVEQVLAGHESVQNVAVIGVPDEKFGQLVAAYVVPRSGTLPADEELKAWCQGKLADFKIPAYIVPATALPLGNTGKVDRKALLAHWMEGRA
ncbi:long-chain acyl-CoA synthetase [Paraburkholderia sp. BL27I4N3]|uniref:class I adenylate-forming enzyme family protein n=1 Tax=Paraburkholderia sp. BL27I4N3 TaxID=1938805 RepID=UPI000E251E69|nr:class I adenylate-forming enzyme family protein [Paraburkholderia sp. BL27I4N3]REE18148.1 long-chain acyl-CoA synthetase [Paraburkholderia sp. BL27I4N3]